MEAVDGPLGDMFPLLDLLPPLLVKGLPRGPAEERSPSFFLSRYGIDVIVFDARLWNCDGGSVI
jgi:hypothetical protein